MCYIELSILAYQINLQGVEENYNFKIATFHAKNREIVTLRPVQPQLQTRLNFQF